MSRIQKLLLVLVISLCGFTSANAGVSFSFTMGSGDFYLSVGDYDYLPYALTTSPGYVPPRISFYDVLSDYGYWVSISPFGQVWVPYASYGWRPYTYGHWVTTQYGQTWVGYEPWAWVGYHYGNFIWTANFGWVWVPGYEWHPGRVIWAQSYNTIGWMPAPPPGYDYSRGYISYVGPYNQFTYYDQDFGSYEEGGYYSYGGPYYDPRYRDLYYNPSYSSIGFNLWIFVDNGHYGYDNYADYYLDRDYTREVFERRLVRIDSRPIATPVLERVVKQKLIEVPVQVREIDTDKQKVKVVVPVGEEEQVRKNANRVVREVIAPAFVEKQKKFKGEDSKNKNVVAKIFKQENAQPRTETVSSDVVIRQAEQAKKNREDRRVLIIQKQKDEVVRIEKEGKVRGPKNDKGNKEQEPKKPESPPPGGSSRDTQFERENKQKKQQGTEEQGHGRGQEQEQKAKKTEETASDKTEVHGNAGHQGKPAAEESQSENKGKQEKVEEQGQEESTPANKVEENGDQTQTQTQTQTQSTHEKDSKKKAKGKKESSKESSKEKGNKDKNKTEEESQDENN